MKGLLVVCVLLLLPFLEASAQPSPSVAVVASPAIRHMPSEKRVARALRHAATDLHVADQELPNVVLVCVDRRAAAVMKLQPSTAVSIDAAPERQVYRVLLVDDISDRAIAAGMVWLVDRHFRLGTSTGQMWQLAAHIRDDLQQTVGADELAAK